MQSCRSQLLALPVDWMGATAKAEVNAVTVYRLGRDCQSFPRKLLTRADNHVPSRSRVAISELPLLAGMSHTQNHSLSLGAVTGCVATVRLHSSHTERMRHHVQPRRRCIYTRHVDFVGRTKPVGSARDHATHRASNEARLIGAFLRSHCKPEPREGHGLSEVVSLRYPRYGDPFTRSAQSAANMYEVRTPDGDYFGEAGVSIKWRIG
ncbi:hypothetical protein AbraIFM66951_008140 [Aspergillus brasiliensis]|uniref:Uncharacterized protein n=1 Tax=Aspergillus brasiliensis TaxID=319629 RepID=A0A9W5YX37_9EURO|nr:hypothetical protein AbraCBS73388_000829 [Aspergillus brasiliensis]GKZ45499.1 hypothetical protein AbraIFM66951_008140 [Aspergillus brasiliensis]